MSRALSVVLKTAERCNIACRYCYFFFAGEESYKIHPKCISQSTVMDVCTFLRDGIKELTLDELHIVFHGGEPMLQSISEFDMTCRRLRQSLEHLVTRFSLSIQTNGTLINEGWIRAFAEHRVRVGVSLDGPESTNDKLRVDHLGRGTYQRVVRGLQRLQEAASQGLLDPPGVLCVIDPAIDGGRVYRHFVDELQIRYLDFLLPDANPDVPPPFEPADYASYLQEIFYAWCDDRHHDVEIKFFSALIRRFGGHRSYLFDHDECGSDDLIEAITISSDGSVWPDDAMRSTSLWQEATSLFVRGDSLKRVLESSAVSRMRHARLHSPITCHGCTWEHLCGGGFLQNRWSSSAGANNASVYCAALKEIYLMVASHLARRGCSAAFFRAALEPPIAHGERN